MISRVIKFRAWGGYATMGGSPEAGMQMFYFSLFDELPIRPFLLDIVMQFTGLLDKNGKEIYEGDIVKFQDNQEKLSAVVWYEKSWSFIPYTRRRSSNKRRIFEVVGNIYENPELLHCKAVDETKSLS